MKGNKNLYDMNRKKYYMRPRILSVAIIESEKLLDGSDSPSYVEATGAGFVDGFDEDIQEQTQSQILNTFNFNNNYEY